MCFIIRMCMHLTWSELIDLLTKTHCKHNTLIWVRNLMHLLCYDNINIIKCNKYAQFNWLIMHWTPWSINTTITNINLHPIFLRYSHTYNHHASSPTMPCPIWASLKKRIDKAMCMKITCVWWRLMKIHLKIKFLVY